MTFALVLLFGTTFGSADAYVLDSGLSYEDCRAAMVAGVSAVELGEGVLLTVEGGALVCELETE